MVKMLWQLSTGTFHFAAHTKVICLNTDLSAHGNAINSDLTVSGSKIHGPYKRIKYWLQ
jgi:hypothetical protein